MTGREGISNQQRLRLLEAAAEQVNDIIVVAEARQAHEPGDARVLYVNKAFERLTGHRCDDVIGNPTTVLEDQLADRAVLEDIAQAMHERRSLRTELISYTRAGNALWFELDLVPLFGEDQYPTHWVSTLRDITGRRLQERRLELVAKASNDFIWEWDAETGKLIRSPEHLEAIGLPPDRVEQSLADAFSTVHPADRAAVQRGLDDALQSDADQWHADYCVSLNDGGVRYFSENVFILRDVEGNPVRIIGGISDTTDLREADLRLQEAQRLEAIGQMTGAMAHDFNNLLMVVMGQAELLAEKADDPAAREKLEAIIMAAGRGADLIDSLLDFARRQSLDPVPADVNGVISDAKRILEQATAGKGVIDFSLDAERSTARVDIERFHATLLNLVLNSAQAIGEGGRISVKTGNILFDENECRNNPGLLPGEYVFVAVADNGEGICKDVLDKVFQPFFTTKDEGTGLGLSSVFGFIKQSGGHVTVESDPGQGTVVRLFLQVTDQDRGRRSGKNAQPAERGDRFAGNRNAESYGRRGVARMMKRFLGSR